VRFDSEENYVDWTNFVESTDNVRVSLEISSVIEQQSLDVAVWGSPDGANWGEKPLLSFPQKFYRGQHPLLLDLSKSPDIKFLRAHWEVNRWGHHAEGPRFEVQLTIKEVPQDVLAEARAHA
jgi:hypothetical protein